MPPKKYILLITFCLSALINLAAEAQNLKLSWSPSTEKELSVEFRLALKTANLQEPDLSSCIKCMIQEFRRIYPKGIDLSEQAWHRAVNDAGNSCIKRQQDLSLESWTAVNEEALKSKIIKMFPAQLEVTLKSQLSSCIIEELKNLYQNGYQAKGDPKKGMDSVFYQLTLSCSEKLNYKGYLRWTKETDRDFQEKVAPYLPQEMSADQKSKYINCIVEKLKAKYPQGISFTPDMQLEFRKVIAIMVEECISEEKG